MKDPSRSRQPEEPKLLCSFNGKFQLRSPAGKLRYVDGEIRIVSIEPNIGLCGLVSKVIELRHCCAKGNNNLSSFSLIYKREDEDCSFVPVTCDRDVKWMIKEYYRKLETLGENPRIWIFVCCSDNAFRCFSRIVVFNGDGSRFNVDETEQNSNSVNNFSSDQNREIDYAIPTGFDSVYCGNQLARRYYPVKPGYGINVHGGIRSLRFAMTDAEKLRAFSYHCRKHHSTLVKMSNRKISKLGGGFIVALDVTKRGHTVRPNHLCSLRVPSCSRIEKLDRLAKTDYGLNNQNCSLNPPYGNQSSVDLSLRNLSLAMATEDSQDLQRRRLKVSDVMNDETLEKSAQITCIYKMAEENEERAEEKDNIKSDKHLPADLVAFYTHLATKELQTIRNSDLEYIKKLGSGTYTMVIYGKWKGSDVTVKKLKPSRFSEDSLDDDRLVADFWKEAYVLNQLHHPNIVALYGVVTDGPVSHFAIVTEYMVNGSLKQVLRRKDRMLDRRKRLFIAMDAAFGMEYLHEKNIIHFDLKSHNFLVSMRDPLRPVCKIGDLGLSKVKQRTLVSGGVRGMIPWMAPELLKSNKMVNEKVDVYSFGIVMWELLTGEEPYVNMKSEKIIDGIIEGTMRPEIPNWCNPGWRSLMERCWASDPNTRPTFSEITKELQAMAATMNIK